MSDFTTFCVLIGYVAADSCKGFVRHSQQGLWYLHSFSIFSVMRSLLIIARRRSFIVDDFFN
jgi:hypothetical protein